MATRATINLLLPDGKVRGIYSHWDGYPSRVGKLLQENYNTLEKVHALLDEGDVSILGPAIGTKHPFEDGAKLCEEQSTFYRRDRGETKVGARVFGAVNQIDRQSYNYLFCTADAKAATEFTDGEWFVLRGNGLEPVAEAVKRELAGR